MVTELEPVNGRKSFYGKAHVIHKGADCFLVSYKTVVAGYVNGAVERYWDGRSNTTSSHIAAFLRCVSSPMSVDEVYRLPLFPEKEVEICLR